MGNSSDDDTSHHEGALLEDIHDQIKGVAEAVGGLYDKVDGIDNRLERVEVKVDGMDNRLGRIENKVDEIDNRLVRVENTTELIPTIKEAITSMSSDIDDHEARLKSLEQQAA
jgi:archaellum component FlaC